VDLGLRLEVKQSPRNPDGRIRRPDQVAVAGAAPTNTLKWVPGNLYDDDVNNWAPSIGFAWDPFGTGKTSIRSNYRMAYDRINTFVLSSQVFQNLPGIVIGLNDATYGQNGGRLAGLPELKPPAVSPESLAQPAPFSNRVITVVDPNFKTPTTHQWSFSIQREVFRNAIVEANYIGRRAYNLFGAYNANQVDWRTNGFMNALNVVNAGGESQLINQLMSVDSRKTAAETGSQALRRIYSVDLRNNNWAFIAQDLSRRVVGGRGQAEAAGLGPYFLRPVSAVRQRVERHRLERLLHLPRRPGAIPQAHERRASSTRSATRWPSRSTRAPMTRRSRWSPPPTRSQPAARHSTSTTAS
jgi:hypothetical protein